MLKKNFKICVLMLILVSLLSTFCLATDTTKTGEVTQQTSNNETTTEATTPEIIRDDVYTTGDSITLDKWYDGNVFVAGATVTLEGQIAGDIFVVANKFVIAENAYVDGIVFAMANEIEMNGIIYDLYTNSAKLTIGESGFIYRDLRANANELTINGKIRRNAHLNANTLTLANNGNALIYGNLKYSSANEITVPEGAVTGEVTFSKGLSDNPISSNIYVSYGISLISTLVLVAIVLLIAFKAFPNGVEKLGKINILLALLIGIVALILVPIISFLLLFTVIGAKAAIALAAAYVVMLALGYTIAAIALGRFIANVCKANNKPMEFLFVIITAAVLWGLSLIPYAGFVIKVLFSVTGFGLLIMAIFTKGTKNKEPKKEVKSEIVKEDVKVVEDKKQTVTPEVSKKEETPKKTIAKKTTTTKKIAPKKEAKETKKDDTDKK